jgi:hypothetical protein
MLVGQFLHGHDNALGEISQAGQIKSSLTKFD